MKMIIFILLSMLWFYTYGYVPKEWHLFLGSMYGVILYGAFNLVDIIEYFEE